jgi:hypothetical protein
MKSPGTRRTGVDQASAHARPIAAAEHKPGPTPARLTEHAADRRYGRTALRSRPQGDRRGAPDSRDSTTDNTGLQGLRRSCAFAVVAVGCKWQERACPVTHRERRPCAPSVDLVQIAGVNHVARRAPRRRSPATGCPRCLPRRWPCLRDRAGHLRRPPRSRKQRTGSGLEVGADQEHHEVTVDLGRVAADQALGHRFGPRHCRTHRNGRRSMRDTDPANT